MEVGLFEVLRRVYDAKHAHRGQVGGQQLEEESAAQGDAHDHFVLCNCARQCEHGEVESAGSAGLKHGGIRICEFSFGFETSNAVGCWLCVVQSKSPTVVKTLRTRS